MIETKKQNSLNNAFEKYSIRPFWPLIFALTFFAAIDIYKRLWIDIESGPPQLTAILDESSPMPAKLDHATHAILMQKLEARLSKVLEFTGSNAVNLASDAGVAADRGVWRSEKNDYHLIGTFTPQDSKSFAVFNRSRLSSTEAELVEFRDGDIIEGFVLTIISHDMISLEDAEGNNILIQLFKAAD